MGTVLNVIMQSYTVPPAPVVTQINPSTSGTQTAGSQFTLTCIALKSSSGLTSFAQTLWTGPNATAVVTGGGITVADPVREPLRTVQTIAFSTLTTAHAGIYSCQGTLLSLALTSAYQTVTSHTVTIAGRMCK